MVQELTKQQKIYKICERVYLYGPAQYRDAARRASICKSTANRLAELVLQGTIVVPNLAKERSAYK